MCLLRYVLWLAVWGMVVCAALMCVAQAIRADPAMAQGFNVIAHSQGGFLARGYVER